MTGDCSGLQPAVSVAGVEVDTLIGVTGVGYLAARGSGTPQWNTNRT